MLDRHSLDNIAADLPPDEVMFGSSAAMQRLRLKAAEAAGMSAPILIEGESGSGKNVLARWLHAHSGRSAGPFVKVHCPAIPAILLENELFGYERATFPGALSVRVGRIEAAAGGSLFLDEVSEVDANLQGRLHRVLRDGRLSQRRGQEERRVDVRCIFSSRIHLSEDAPSCWDELFAGIELVHLQLAPLRKRRADIPSLAQYMVKAWGRRYNVPVRGLSNDILNLLQASAWPANLRQLENMMKRYVVLGCEEETISAELLTQTQVDQLARVSAGDSVVLKDAVRERVKEQERRIILRALHDHHWDTKSTAQALGITYQALLHKMRLADMSPDPQGHAAHEGGSKERTFLN